jgi:hypothetical protein
MSRPPSFPDIREVAKSRPGNAFAIGPKRLIAENETGVNMDHIAATG